MPKKSVFVKLRTDEQPVCQYEVFKSACWVVSRGIYLPDKKVPTFVKVAEDWLNYKKPNLRESTWSVYECHTKNYFHELDQLQVNRINTSLEKQRIGTPIPLKDSSYTEKDIPMEIIVIRFILNRFCKNPQNTFWQTISNSRHEYNII